MAVKDGRLVSQDHGLDDKLEPLLDGLLGTGAVEIIELFDRLDARLLQFVQRGPFEEKRGGQWTPELFAAQIESLRKILF